MLQLNDKVAIVTGAGRGNGRGVAMALADHGAAVMVSTKKTQKMLQRKSMNPVEKQSLHIAM